MTTEQIIGLSLALLLMFVGLIGSILPGLPSTPLVLIAAVGHRLYFADAGAATWVLVTLGLITAFSLVVDYLASWLGAKKMGATWKGVLGAVVGGLIGLFFGIPGILLGPFLGAFLFEVATGREIRESARAGLGATLGLLAGAIGKIACCIAMAGLFAVNVIVRSTSGL